jgi:uncharacterized protein YpmS
MTVEPWHFFALLSLAFALIVVFIARGIDRRGR